MESGGLLALNKSQNQVLTALRQEFLRRCRQNPRYSLRAYARQLQMDCSTLSKILRGQRKLGERAVLRLGRKIGARPELSGAAREGLGDPAGSYSVICEDVFQSIADWYHMAILELLRTRDFKSSEEWVAQKLCLSVDEVSSAIQRLKRLGLLEISPSGKWLDRSGGKTTNIFDPQLTSKAQREFQKQILQKAIRALDEVAIEERDQSGMTMAVHSERIPEAKIRIRRFRRELARFLSRGEAPKEVFQLSISLFPLTRTQSSKGKIK